MVLVHRDTGIPPAEIKVVVHFSEHSSVVTVSLSPADPETIVRCEEAKNVRHCDGTIMSDSDVDFLSRHSSQTHVFVKFVTPEEQQ
jgi:hypothetical protein